MLVGRRGLSPVMIGRASALAELDALVRGRGREHNDGLPSIGLVEGEAGVGKSRLLRELIAGFPPETVVLVAHTEPNSLGRPLDAVRTMLGDSLTAHDDSRRVAVDEIVARVGDHPAVVIFEDLHWADADSVSVLEQLASMTLPSLTLIATYRPDDLTSRLPGGEMLVRLERRRHVRQIHLERLDRFEVAAFVNAVYGRPVSTTVVDALRRRTGGNPFFIEEILAAAADTEPDALADQPLPWSLAELVSQELDGLSSQQRRVVEAAAVLGSRARFDVLAALSEHTEDELIADLRVLTDRALLAEDTSDKFSFRHELVRDAVEHQLLGRERRRLHERALDALIETADADLADLARHAAGAGRYDQMVELARDGVVHYLGLGSTHQALQLATTALGEAPDDPDLLAGAARAAWLIGVNDEAWSHVQRLLAVTTGEGGARRSAAIRLAARIAHERGDRERMWALIDDLVATVDQLPAGEERALAIAAIAQINMLNDEPERAVEWAERAIAEASAAGAKGVLAQAIVERATAMTDIAELREEGTAALREAVEEAERIEDWVLLTRAINNLINVSSLAERRELVERMRDAGRRAGYDSLAAASYYNRLAELAIAEGDADAVLRNAVRAGDFVQHKTHGWATQIRIMTLLEAGRRAEAVELAETLASAARSGQGEKCAWPVVVMLAAAGTGGREATTAALVEAIPNMKFGGKHSGVDVLLAVEAALGGGVAEADIRSAEADAGVTSSSESFAVLFEVMLAGARADHDTVVRLLEARADELLAELPAPLKASYLTWLARALAAQSRMRDARTHAVAARALLERWPGWRRDAVDALLSRLDGATVSSDGDLTRRELEVAALLAEGLSNAELAKRLYISRKTAAVHVSNILGKLGMSSRAEIAAWVVRRGA